MEPARRKEDVAMMVKNYREVRAAPIVNQPGVTVRWLVSELDESPGYALRLYEMEPEAATAAQSHYWEHEVFVLSGSGVIAGGESEIPLGEGDVVYVAPAERHRFVNRGDEVLRFLMVLPIAQHTSPPGE
jgi:quercetin dioxygenase-like cupin family protein